MLSGRGISNGRPTSSCLRGRFSAQTEAQPDEGRGRVVEGSGQWGYNEHRSQRSHWELIAFEIPLLLGWRGASGETWEWSIAWRLLFEEIPTWRVLLIFTTIHIPQLDHHSNNSYSAGPIKVKYSGFDQSHIPTGIDSDPHQRVSCHTLIRPRSPYSHQHVLFFMPSDPQLLLPR